MSPIGGITNSNLAGKYKVEVQVTIGQMDANGNIRYGSIDNGRLTLNFSKQIKCEDLKGAFEIVDKFDNLTRSLEE